MRFVGVGPETEKSQIWSWRKQQKEKNFSTTSFLEPKGFPLLLALKLGFLKKPAGVSLNKSLAEVPTNSSLFNCEIFKLDCTDWLEASF